MAQLKHFFCKWLKVCVLAFFPGLFWVENPKGRILKRKTCCAFLPFKCKACQDFKCIANMRRLKNHIPHNLSHQTILLKPCHKINHLFTSLLTSPNKKKHVACLGLGLSVCVFFSFQWKLKTLALVAPVHSRNPYHKSGETLRRPTKRGGSLWGHMIKTCPWNMPGINPGKDANDVSIFHWKSCHCHWMSMFIPKKTHSRSTLLETNNEFYTGNI